MVKLVRDTHRADVCSALVSPPLGGARRGVKHVARLFQQDKTLADVLIRYLR